MFPDPRLVAAIVDRVTFNAHIVETGTQSYRLATSKTSNRKRASWLWTPTIDRSQAGALGLACGLGAGRLWPPRAGPTATEALTGLILGQ